MKIKLSMPKYGKLGVMLCASVILMLSAMAHAEQRPLDAPRMQGLIGERYDGYAVVHDTQASAEIRALIEITNSERRKVYEQQAAAIKAPVAEVGKVYAAEILLKAPPGTWLQGADGSWKQK